MTLVKKTKKKRFTSFGQSARLITCPTYGDPVTCSCRALLFHEITNPKPKLAARHMSLTDKAIPSIKIDAHNYGLIRQSVCACLPELFK